jgi:hypothetical protein
VTLLNQSRAAIVYNGLEAASAVGLTVRLTRGSRAVALEVTAGPASQWGEFSMIDSVLDFDYDFGASAGRQAAGVGRGDTVISTEDDGNDSKISV